MRHRKRHIFAVALVGLLVGLSVSLAGHLKKQHEKQAYEAGQLAAPTWKRINITGYVYDEKDRPITTAYVIAEPLETYAGTSRLAVTNDNPTDAQGHFVFDELPGKYRLKVQSPYYYRGFVIVKAQSGQTVTTRIVLKTHSEWQKHSTLFKISLDNK